MRDEERYFKWLYGTIEHPFSMYTKLFAVMCDVEFVALVPFDQNRIGDALRLRNQFSNETGVLNRALMGLPVTVLEVLVGLSERMWELAYDPDNDNSSLYWFWMLVRNLGLTDYDDPNCDEEDLSRIRDILVKFVNREYEENGTGGLFPLDYPEEDQREVELWYQMQHYMEGFVI
jgi:hypothetical protein